MSRILFTGGMSRPRPRGEVRGSGWGVSRPRPRRKVGGSGWGVSRSKPRGRLRVWLGMSMPTPRGCQGPHLGGPGPHPEGIQAQARGDASQHALRQTPPLPADSYCCRQYASYWNAFLSSLFLLRTKQTSFVFLAKLR